MELVMLEKFEELSETEMKVVDGGHIDWGELGYGSVKVWCDFWSGVGEKVYDLLH